jgi:tRNA pseudouridine13 synthase
VLARRVELDNWRTALAGEVFALHGSGSVFRQPVDEVLRCRLAAGDVYLSGPLPGRATEPQPADAVAVLEQDCLAEHADLIEALQASGVDAARRSLRVAPLDWRCEQRAEDSWRLSFSLPKGCFATGVVRELVRLNPAPAQAADR